MYKSSKSTAPTATPGAITRDARPVPKIEAVTVGSLCLFLLMSLIWGGTWVAVKAGVTAVPPVFFAALRFGLVAALLAVMVRNWATPFGFGFVGRTLLTGLLVNTGTYSLLFWGMQFVDSGIAGLINLSLVPLGLFALSVLLGDERPSWRHALALGLGAAGLVVLFWDGASLAGTSVELWGDAGDRRRDVLLLPWNSFVTPAPRRVRAAAAHRCSISGRRHRPFRACYGV